MKACLPDDPALPLLHQALDAGAMQQAFVHLLQPHGTLVDGCHIERVKYRPRRNCSLSYLLRLRDVHGQALPDQRVAARLCNGDGARRAASAARGPLQVSTAGPSLHWLPALDMLTWWWPNDGKLAAPRVLADEDLLRTEVLPPVVAALSGGLGRLVAHRVEVVQYVPESRVTARVDLRWSARGSLHRCHVYAKASREPEGAVAHQMLRDLQESPAWRCGSLHTPQALLWQPAFGLQWQTALPGIALLDLQAAAWARLGPQLGERLGAQLAALHGVPVRGARPIDGLHERLVQVVDVLGTALPGQAGALQSLAARLSAGLSVLQGLPAVTLHGDLHPRNVLVDTDDGHRLGLIDLDGMARGPALLEFGAVVAEGLYRALLEGAAPTRDAPYWHALERGYVHAGGAPMARAALAWSTAWSLLTERVWRCVVNLKPGRLALVPRLVELAAQLVDAPGPEVLS